MKPELCTEHVVDGFAITLKVQGSHVTCSSFDKRILYSALWEDGILMQCSIGPGTTATVRQMPPEMLAAFQKLRDAAVA